ncbi:MAG: hypothetical protein IKL25_08715 [Clostridia bacterium]|nr:hypothetical protein [Clostridia bacterium]
MKKVFKTLLIALGIIIVLHLLLFGVVIYSAFDPISKTDTNWNNYDMYRTELHYAEEFLPSQNEFSNTKAVHFSYQKNFMLMFISKTVAVTVQYTPEEYLGAKESLTQRYEFLDAPMLQSGDNNYILDNAFTYKGYDFRVVSYGYGGCKYFGMVGTNDDTCSIAYLYYSDTDLDYIAQADEDLDQKMRALIDDEFCWEPFTE